MGRPILASAAGDLRRVVEDSGAGWVAEPEDPADIARVIREAASAGSAALDSRGVRGRAFYNANMSARIGGNAYAEMVDTWLPRQGSRH